MRDTIAAIASGITASGIGIVRISGPGAFRVLEKIFRPANPDKKIMELPANTIHYGFIFDENEKIDEVLALIMKAPHTYTAEDTVEIDCHGGPFVMQKILSCALRAGARLAEPGEFTRRAFMNGRIDLSEAEAVMDVIGAGSDDALKSSLMQLGGSVRREISDLREKIISEVAYIEAALDDPEHMDLSGYPWQLAERLTGVKNRLTRLRDSFNEGKMIREGIYTVILGKPNAGKSSLLNAMTGEDRAIVTEIAGTTRDSLEENIRLGGLSLRLADTAGIRQTGDLIEKIGVERARSLAEKADLILAVFDSSAAFDDNDEDIFSFIRGRKAIVLLNKSDLPACITEEDVRARCDAPCVVISAKKNEGISTLAEIIRKMFFGGNLRINEQTMITNVRHREAVEDTLHSIDLVFSSIEAGMPEDFFTVDLMDAYASLGKITGEEIGDDLVDAIFSKFCMGK